MNTGMPNGRAILTPGPGAAGGGPWRFGSPGVIPATRPMLRPGTTGQHGHRLVSTARRARPARPAGPGQHGPQASGQDAPAANAEITATVGGVPYPPRHG